MLVKVDGKRSTKV